MNNLFQNKQKPSLKSKIPRAVYFYMIFISLFTASPYLYGYMHGSPGFKYFGFMDNPHDHLYYLSMVKQITEGNIFPLNLYSPESTTRLLFRPFFLLIGLCSMLTGVFHFHIYIALRFILVFICTWAA